MTFNPNFVSPSDLVQFSIGAHNRGVQPGVAWSKIDDLFARFGDRLRLVHEDSRRSIREYVGPDFTMNQFEVLSDEVPLGNHYHRKASGEKLLEDAKYPGASEIFFIDAGRGELLLQNIDLESQKSVGLMQRIRIMTQDLLVIAPGQAHTLYLEPGTKFRGFRPYPFHVDDMDMNPYVLK